MSVVVSGRCNSRHVGHSVKLSDLFFYKSDILIIFCIIRIRPQRTSNLFCKDVKTRVWTVFDCVMCCVMCCIHVNSQCINVAVSRQRHETHAVKFRIKMFPFLLK